MFMAAELSAPAFQDGRTGEYGGIAEFFLDAEQLVVLADAVGTACRTGLDHAGVQSHNEVGDGGVFRFA